VTATISLVAESQPEGVIAAAARMIGSVASVEARVEAQRAALAQLASGWRGDAATAALVRAEKDLQRLLGLQIRLQATQSTPNSGGMQLSSLRTHLLDPAGQATALGGLVGDDGSVRTTGIGDFMTPAMAETSPDTAMPRKSRSG
jgi:hypothetical protein